MPQCLWQAAAAVGADEVGGNAHRRAVGCAPGDTQRLYFSVDRNGNRVCVELERRHSAREFRVHASLVAALSRATQCVFPVASLHGPSSAAQCTIRFVEANLSCQAVRQLNANGRLRDD